MRRVTTIAGIRVAVADVHASGGRVALVPTLGALHAGHLANVALAATLADTVVVSIFVNPTQFDRADDLAAYPRDLEGDEAALAGLGEGSPDLVFAPAQEEVYPRTPVTTVHVAGVTERLEGASRPGHFDGVATVVAKLFNMVQPDVALFGRKDAQQNQVIRRMVDDLDIPVALVLGPTIRESEGLALSSRNRRLSQEERGWATALPLALRSAVDAARAARAAGRMVTPGLLREAAAATLATVPQVVVDYLEVVDPDTFAPPDELRGEEAGVAVAPHSGESGEHEPPRLVVVLAASVGRVRLIDNVEVGDPEDEERLIAAT